MFLPCRFPSAIPSAVAHNGRPLALAALATRSRPSSWNKPQPAVISTSPDSRTTTEMALRLAFMENLMERARAQDPVGVDSCISDMIAVGLNPGPRSFHGLVVSYTLLGDEEGAMHSLRRELTAGLCPLHETFISLIRLLGSRGRATQGVEVLAEMEEHNYDTRTAWITLVEELVKNKFLDDANRVFLEGAESGLRATDELYDLLIEEDCKAGDHSNALTVAYKMEAAGRMATTFHFNCLLSVQAYCGIPEIALETFENMEYSGEDYMRPDVETYNWMIQAYINATCAGRLEDLADLLCLMIEDHKRVQPNARTYALLVDFFLKYGYIDEAIRHFRALKNFPDGTKLLHQQGNQGGNQGDPLSSYLLTLCYEGRVREMLEALEAMSKDNQQIPSWALKLNGRYRSLVSCWIEPLNEEADVGYEIDYIARYIGEGGLTGEGMHSVHDYRNPTQLSFMWRCSEEWRLYHSHLLEVLLLEGPAALGDVDMFEYFSAVEALTRVVSFYVPWKSKRKIAIKIVEPELREKLQRQGLGTVGIRRYRSWISPKEGLEEEVEGELQELISRIKPRIGDTEFWRKRFLGEEVIKFESAGVGNVSEGVKKKVKVKNSETEDDIDIMEDEEDEDDEEDDNDAMETVQDDININRYNNYVDDLPEDPLEVCKESKKRRIFDESDMYTKADAWGWTWEKEIQNQKPQKWSKVWEADLAVKVMQKVIELGGTPTISDCAMVLHAAIKAPLPTSFSVILRAAHSLGYTFGGRLYDEVITLCLDLGELDIAATIVADMETAGKAVPDQTLDKVLSARSSIGYTAAT